MKQVKAQAKSRGMPRRPGVIKTIKAAPDQQMKNSCESTETQASFSQKFLQNSHIWKNGLTDLYYECKFEDDQIYEEMKSIIESLIRKNDFLIKDRAKLIRENLELQSRVSEMETKNLQSKFKAESGGKFEEQLRAVRQIEKQGYMINSLEGKLDFFTLSKVASKNKIFYQPLVQTHRSENCQQNQMASSVNKNQKFQSWGNSFQQKSQNSYCDSLSQSEINSCKNKNKNEVSNSISQFRRAKNIQEKQSFIQVRSRDSGKIFQNLSQYCNTKRQGDYDQTSLADEIRGLARNRVKYDTQVSLPSRFIPEKSENQIFMSKESYRCYQDLEIKPKDSFSISQICHNQDRQRFAMLELKNCEQINSLIASKQIYEENYECYEDYTETPRNAHPRIYKYLGEGGQAQGYLQGMPQLETPTLQNQNQQRKNIQQMLGQNRFENCIPIPIRKALNKSSQRYKDPTDTDIVRCESSTKFSPLRCFYICMLNNKQMVTHFMGLLSQFRQSENEVINELYRDNKLWVSVAEKFVKDYWKGTLFSHRQTDRYLMENSLSASTLMRYITDNQLIDIIMIAILKKRLSYIFDSKVNSFIEAQQGQNNQQVYDADQIFKALANQFNLELTKFQSQYKFYRGDTNQSNLNDDDSYLLASNNQNIRFANSGRLSRVLSNQMKEVKPIFTIYHRQDLGMFQFILPKNQITKEDMKIFNKKNQGRPRFYSASQESQESISYHFKENISNISHNLSINHQGILKKMAQAPLKKESQVQFECSSISECPMSVNTKSQRLLFDSVEPSANKINTQEKQQKNGNEDSQQEVSNFGQNKRRSELNQTGKMRLALQEISLKNNVNMCEGSINAQQRYQIASPQEYLLQDKLKNQNSNQNSNQNYSPNKRPFIPPLKIGKSTNEVVGMDSKDQKKAFPNLRPPTSSRYPSMENSFMTVNLDSKRNVNLSYSFQQKDEKVELGVKIAREKQKEEHENSNSNSGQSFQLNI